MAKYKTPYDRGWHVGRSNRYSRNPYMIGSNDWLNWEAGKQQGSRKLLTNEDQNLQEMWQRRTNF